MKTYIQTKIIFILFLVPCLLFALNATVFAAMQTSIQEAIENKTVKVDIIGNGLTSVQVKMTRLSKDSVKVLIPAGTIFDNKSDAQDMIALRDTVIDLSGSASASISVWTACINFNKNTPDKYSKFTIAEADPKLNLLVKTINSKNPTVSIIQEATWIVTDNITREELNHKYLSRSITGQVKSVVYDEDVIEAMQLIEASKINTGDLKIFTEKISAVRAVKYHNNPSVRNYALKQLQVKAVNDTDIYLELLKGTEHKARCEAAAQLGELKDKKTLQQMMEILKQEINQAKTLPLPDILSDQEVFILDMCEALAGFNDERTFDILISAMEVFSNNNMIYIGGALAQIENPKLTVKLINIVNGVSKGNMLGAIVTLGKMVEPSAIKAITKQLLNHSKDIQSESLNALASITFSSSNILQYDLVEYCIYILKTSDDLSDKFNASFILCNVSNQNFEEDVAKWESWWKVNKSKYKR